MKTIIERGASWTLEETKLLLTLWGQDQVSRKDTPHKRTKEVYEKISEKFKQGGFERTPDQVRTRVFNMIAEYRRILKDPNPERMKKCIFFDAMHKIYQAEHWSEVKALIDDYEPDTNPFSPASNSKLSETMEESISDSEGMDGQQHDNSSMEASNASNSVSNNNNTNSMSAAAAAPHLVAKTAANNDTTNSATTASTTTSTTTTTNSNSGSGTNNKTSATSDNIANNSINDNHAAKKNVASKEFQLVGGVASKRIKIDSPKAGTSQGETNIETITLSGDGKQIKVLPNNSNAAGVGGVVSSSASNAQHAPSFSISSTNNASSSASSSGKQQSLLANSSSSSTSSTPITKLTPTGNNSASYININSTKLPIIRSQFLNHSNGNESININGTPATTTRLPTTAAITSHQLYQAPVNTFDVTSSALLIDRMFAHLSKESENMREWIALEKDRIALEKTRRAQETEREIRRERVLIDTLMKFHEQWINFVSRLDPRLMEGAAGQLPELNIPPKESDPNQPGSLAASQTNQISSASTTSSVNVTSLNSATAGSSASSSQIASGGGSGTSGGGGAQTAPSAAAVPQPATSAPSGSATST